MPLAIPKLMTLEKTAVALGLTVQQLRWLRSQGKGPDAARIGGRVYFREDDVARWANHQFEKEKSE